jgi:ligand-binding sensor domain-containing protein
MWVGTERGAAHFDGKTWTVHRQGSLAHARVLDIAIAPDDSVWLAGSFDGIFHFDGETWTHYTHSIDKSTTPYTSVFRFDGETWPDYDPDFSVVGAVAVTPDGALWFNTVNGVSRFDGQTRTTYTTADGLPHNSVTVLTVAPDGTLWAGTGSGVAWFDGKRWNPLTVTDTPPDPQTLADPLRNVEALAIEPNGTVWIGTMDKGLWRYVPPD